MKESLQRKHVNYQPAAANFSPNEEYGGTYISPPPFRVVSSPAPSIQQKEANSKPTDAVHTAPPSSKEALIQRAVGYEFETGWKGQRHIPGTGFIGLGKRYENMQKLDPLGTLGTAGQFRIESDDGGIEFIIDPPVEETPKGSEDLILRMNSMLAIVNSLVARGASGRPFMLNKAINSDENKAYKIIPLPGEPLMKAGPQVTTGLDLGKIPQMRDAYNEKFEEDNGEGGLRTKEGVNIGISQNLKSMTNAYSTASINNRGIVNGANRSEPLIGLLSILIQYIFGGVNTRKHENEESSSPLQYHKIIAGRLLAKTDFVQLFRLLPLPEQNYFRANPNEWVTLVITSLRESNYGQLMLDGVLRDDTTRRDANLNKDNKLFEKGIKEKEKPDITVEQWLLNMLNLADEDLKSDGLKAIDPDQSMGALGNKMDKIGKPKGLPGNKHRDKAGIFEFRGIQDQKLPPSQWLEFAVQFHEYISHLHRK